MSKLSLDRDTIDLCRKLAEQIVSSVLHNVERHSTVSIERCVLRMMGVEGTLEEKPKGAAPQGRMPLVNEVIAKIGQKNLTKGAGYWLALAALHHPRLSPTNVARKIASGEINLEKLEYLPFERVDILAQNLLAKTLSQLRTQGEKRARRPSWRLSSAPLRYVIVATGDIHEDILQAQAAAEMGADIIAVIRSTAQSLLDYVPEGETIEGFGGTYATQENFRLMRQALDTSEKKLKRRIGLTNYSSGLCMPEIALLGALEGLDYLLNDAMYGILFRDINPKRNFIDQNFSRRICSLSDITIQTGEDNYLTTADSQKYWYQVLGSHFINHAFARKAGLPEEAIALGHAHEIDPWTEDSILFEWAQAQLVREVFPRCPIKFMPPTKHKTGDIFFSYLYDGLFNLAGILTGQSIQLLGMHTEAIHNPFVQDRFLSLKSAEYVFHGAKSIKDEIYFQPNGKIARRARQVLDDALRLLRKIKDHGLLRAIEEGAFANVRRTMQGGKGLDGVIEKDRDYYTPLARYLTPKVAGEREDLLERYNKVTRERTRQRGRPTPERGPRSSPERGGRRDPRGRGGRDDRRDDRPGDRRNDRRRGRQGAAEQAPARNRGSAAPAPSQAPNERPPEQAPPPPVESPPEVILLPPPAGEASGEAPASFSAPPEPSSGEGGAPRRRRGRRGGRSRRGRGPHGEGSRAPRAGGAEGPSPEGSPPILLPERMPVESSPPEEKFTDRSNKSSEGNEE